MDPRVTIPVKTKYRPPYYMTDEAMVKRVYANGREAYIKEVKGLGFEICECPGRRLPNPRYMPGSGTVGVYICSECALIQWTLNYVYACDECTEPVLHLKYPPVGPVKHSDC